tara:strand:+ start:146 stop:1168 length:1023 start_codon:yes stop_codon:yes gene_type:complete
MGFKMKGFNAGRGTGTDSSFKKTEVVFNKPKAKRNTKIIDGKMYYDSETDRRDPGDFSNVRSIDINPKWKGGDYRLPGEDVDTRTDATLGYGSNVKYSPEHEKYMGIKDAGAGYGPEEIGLKNKQERLNEERAIGARKLIQNYKGTLPITPESTEYNKENYDVWRSDPRNKKQAGETQAQYQRRFKNDLADLANIVNEVQMSAEAGFDLSKPYANMGVLSENDIQSYNVDRGKEEIWQKNRELDYDRSRNIKIERYKNRINKRIKDGYGIPDFEARKLIEMGEGHIVEAAERAQMTPKERKKHDRKTARAERRSERKSSREERRSARQRRRQIRKAERRG